MTVSLAAVAALALTSCGGGSGGGVGGPGMSDPVLPPVQLQASKPGALLSYVRQKLIAQIDQGLTANGDGVVTLSGLPLVASAATTAAAGLTTIGFASTTLQEGGVDESDLLKTDGNRVFAMTVATAGDQRLARLTVHQRQANGSLLALSSLDLPKDDRFDGLHLAASGEQLAIVGQNQQYLVMLAGGNPLAVTSGTAASLTVTPGITVPIQTVVNLVSAKAGQPLATTANLRIDGQLIDTRTIDNTLYVVTSWFPRFDGVFPATGASVVQRKEAVARVTSQQVLPTITITGATGQPVTQTLMADTDCQLQAANASVAVQLTTITAIDLASPNAQRSSRCLLGGVNAIYMSAKNLYLATSRFSVVAQGNNLFYPGEPVTDIHKFAVNAMAIGYRGSGEVNGHLGWDASKTSYRLSEFQSDLRVLTYANGVGWQGDIGTPDKSAPVSPAMLTVLREDAATGQLKTIATLPNSRRPAPIGLSGEQVYAVRFLGDRGYVVTFRRIDPLYVVDLADPTDPKVAGELKTNGYSDYLLPAGDGLLLGVGKDATAAGVVQGVKVSLFDVANAAAPKELATRIVGQAGSLSGLDFGRHGVNLFPVGAITRVALPVRLNDTPTATGSSFRPSNHRLLRFEVDAVSKTLIDLPSLTGQTFTNDSAGYLASSLAFERSVQIGAGIYYLGSNGVMTGAAW